MPVHGPFDHQHTGSQVQAMSHLHRAVVEDPTCRYNYSHVTRHSEHAEAQKPGWRPFYLQRRIVIIFVFAFCGVIATLETLNHLSKVNYGLASSSQNLHYTWTYGPTVILTVIASFWSRVEFQAKQNAPWQAMSEKATEAQKSVLLDYITVMQPLAVINALKNRHFSVAFGATCSMLLNLLIIFSTGLFSLQGILVPHAEIVLLENRFTGEDMQFSSGLGLSPYEIINAVTFKNINYPIGTTQDLAYQHFSAPSASDDAIVSATIQGLETNLNCEPADLHVNTWETTSTSGVRGLHDSKTESKDIDISSSSCKILNVNLADEGARPGYQSTSELVTTRYVSKFMYGQCNGTSGTNGQRILATLVDVRQGNSTTESSIDGVTKVVTKLVIDRSVQLICNPTYSLMQLRATKNTSEPLTSVHLARDLSSISEILGVTAWDIAEPILNSSNVARYSDAPIGSNNPFPTNNSSTDGTRDIDYHTQLAAWMIGKTGDINVLFAEGVLSNALSIYFRAMAAQYSHRGLLISNVSETLGSTNLIENRVLIMQLPLRVMEVCLLLGILLALAIMLLNARHAAIMTPWNPNSISAVAATLSRSNSLRQSLAGTSGSQISALQSKLSRSKFFIKSTPDGMRIETKDHEDTEEPKPTEYDPRDEGSFKPFPSFVFRVIIFVMVALMIVALEVVLQVSQSNDGLGYVSSNEYMHYLWTVVPAVLMVAISLSYGSLNFNSRCISLYKDLKRPWGAVFERFMLINLLDSTNLVLILKSIRSRHFAVLLTTTATFLTPLLTVITSGLYSVVSVPELRTMDFAQQTFFGSGGNTSNNSTIDPETTAEYIVTMNLSYPRWTFNKYAFPQLSLEASPDLSVLNNTFVDLVIPSLRAAHPCHIPTSDQLNATWKRGVAFGENTVPSSVVSINTPQLNGSYEAKNISWGKSKPASEFIFINDGLFGQAARITDDIQVYLWGKLTNGSFEHVAAMFCTKGIETVDTQTRFTLPTFDISEENPPIPIESSAKAAENQNITWSSWSSSFAAVTDQVDSFFQALVTGRYAIPVDHLGKPERDEEVVQAIKFQDGILQAQGWNSGSRVAVNKNMDIEHMTGTVTLKDRRRLIQDTVSTRILDALLAAILGLGIFGAFLLNTDSVLPKNPCSIAAVASFLSDSNFLDRYQNVGDPNDLSIAHRHFQNTRFFFRQHDDASNLEVLEASSEKNGPDAFTIIAVDPVDNAATDHNIACNEALVTSNN